MNLFNKTFFKFAFGFLSIIAASFVLINVLAGGVENQHPENLGSASNSE